MVEPQVNQWYKLQDTPLRFEILAVREDFLIVQLDNGTIEEYSLEQWEEMVPLPIDQSSAWGMSWSQEHDSLHVLQDESDEEIDNDYYELSAEFLDDDLQESHDY